LITGFPRREFSFTALQSTALWAGRRDAASSRRFY
jgi:hypothetical protein